MFDICANLVTQQDEISGLETIGWEKHSWKYLSLIGDVGSILQNPESNEAWEQRLRWIKSSLSKRNFDRIDGEPDGFQVEHLPMILYVAALRQSQEFY